MPAKPSTRPGMMNLPVQSMMRAPLGTGRLARVPTSVMRPFCTITTASCRSFAERPQSVTSTTVPPTSTSGTGAWGACDAARSATGETAQIHSRKKRTSRMAIAQPENRGLVAINATRSTAAAFPADVRRRDGESGDPGNNVKGAPSPGLP